MHVHERYQHLAQETVNLGPRRPEILKTDCWNEGKWINNYYFPVATLFPAEQTTCLELNPKMITKALADCPELRVVEGSIVKMPFVDKRFDVLLDVSTIDHIPDPAVAIGEYARVVRPGGMLLIVSWFTDNAEIRNNPKPDQWDELQYYFDLRPFQRALASRFTILRQGKIPELAGENYLWHFIARRMDN